VNISSAAGNAAGVVTMLTAAPDAVDGCDGDGRNRQRRFRCADDVHCRRERHQGMRRTLNGTPGASAQNVHVRCPIPARDNAGPSRPRSPAASRIRLTLF
jgi:hypothetical protein